MGYSWDDVGGGTNVATGVTSGASLDASLTVASVPFEWNGDTLQLTVTNAYGSNNLSVKIIITNGTPTLTAEYPITHTNVMTLYGGSGGVLGSSPTFSVGVQGYQPISYQWRTNGVAMAGATSASFTFTNAQMDSPTNFDCVVTNTFGSITSMVWRVAYVPAPTASFPQSVLGLHPVGYWRLNEPDNGLSDGNPGAICTDYAGGNNGYYTNIYLGILSGYSASTDPDEASAQFGTYVSSGSFASWFPSNIDFGTPAGSNAEFSVAAWVNGQSQPQDWACGFVSIGLYGHEQFVFAHTSSILFAVVDAAGNAYNAFSSLNLSADTNWHYVVGVCDEPNGAVSCYVDGQLSSSVAIAPGAGLHGSGGTPLMIGARSSSGIIGDYQFRGNMNDVAIYNFALTPEQVVASYQAGTTLTLSIANLGDGQLQLIWGAGALQGATNVAGPYMNIPSATAPYTLQATNAQQFYRLKN